MGSEWLTARKSLCPFVGSLLRATTSRISPVNNEDLSTPNSAYQVSPKGPLYLQNDSQPTFSERLFRLEGQLAHARSEGSGSGT